MFCYYEKCEHYRSEKKYGAKCYYEPQCWRGWLDTILLIFRITNMFRTPVKYDR
jgi:hypothetical protein